MYTFRTLTLVNDYRARLKDACDDVAAEMGVQPVYDPGHSAMDCPPVVVGLHFESSEQIQEFDRRVMERMA